MGAPITRQHWSLTLRCKLSTLGNIEFAEPDDDIHYTILGLMLLEERGFGFSKLDVANNHLRNIPYHWLWSCTRQSYYHMVNLTEERPIDEQIAEFPTKLNPWREGINTAIRARLLGLYRAGRSSQSRPHRLPGGHPERRQEWCLQLYVCGLGH